MPDRGGTREAGKYLVGYSVEEAEGMYKSSDGELTWREPGEDNLNVEIAVSPRRLGGSRIPKARGRRSLSSARA